MADSKEKQRKRRTPRNFPHHSLEETLALPQKIADEMGGKPFKRLLLADALGTTPSSSNFRDLISSSYKYGLTLGSYKSSDISLTELGEDVTQHKDAQKRLTALRRAVMNPEVFQQFFSDFQDKKIPSDDMLGKILVAEYKVPEGSAEECAKFIVENGRFVGIIRDISGSPHVLFDTDFDLEESVPLVEESASNIYYARLGFVILHL